MFHYHGLWCDGISRSLLVYFAPLFCKASTHVFIVLLRFLEVLQGRDEVALEIADFMRSHQGLLDRILRDDAAGVQLADLEELQLATAIASKVEHPFENSMSYCLSWGCSVQEILNPADHPATKFQMCIDKE
jgi:hypothetical protein